MLAVIGLMGHTHVLRPRRVPWVLRDVRSMAFILQQQNAHEPGRPLSQVIFCKSFNKDSIPFHESSNDVWNGKRCKHCIYSVLSVSHTCYKF